MTTNNAKLLFLIIDSATGYIEKINGNKYLSLIPTHESKEKLKKHEQIWNIIKDLFRSINDNSDDYLP